MRTAVCRVCMCVCAIEISFLTLLFYHSNTLEHRWWWWWWWHDVRTCTHREVHCHRRRNGPHSRPSVRAHAENLVAFAARFGPNQMRWECRKGWGGFGRNGCVPIVPCIAIYRALVRACVCLLGANTNCFYVANNDGSIVYDSTHHRCSI